MAEDSREPATAYLHIGDLICLRLEVRSLANLSHLLHPWEPEVPSFMAAHPLY